jgi:hypothetical protein
VVTKRGQVDIFRGIFRVKYDILYVDGVKKAAIWATQQCLVSDFYLVLFQLPSEVSEEESFWTHFLSTPSSPAGMSV